MFLLKYAGYSLTYAASAPKNTGKDVGSQLSSPPSTKVDIFANGGSNALLSTKVCDDSHNPVVWINQQGSCRPISDVIRTRALPCY